jgi:hypothetical protein
MFKFKTIDVANIPFKNLLIVLLSIVCITSVRECSNKSLEVERAEGQWKFKYASMVKDYTTETNELGEQLAYQEQLLIDEKQAKDILKMENSSLKKIASSTKVKTVTKIKEVFIPFDEVVSARELSPTNEVDTTAKPFGLTTEWYSFNGKVLHNGIKLDSVSFNNKITTNIGWKKDKWYKKKYAVVEVKSSNPHTQVTGMQNIVVAPRKKKFFETSAFKVGVGVLGGLYLSKKL